MDSKAEVVRQFLQPSSAQKLREFLGLINFYHRFIPHCAYILHPLHTLLAAARPSQELLWIEETTAAFNKAKEALANATLLNHPKPSAPTSITTDASDIAVGAVLQQFVDGVWCPTYILLLQPSETQYSTSGWELLAVYLSIKHFRHFVEGCDFHIRTDHKPLTFAMGTRPDRQSPRQTRQLDFISQFTSDIRYVKGSENTAADALSRITINSASSTIDFQAIALAQQNDPELSRLQANPTSLNLRPIPLPSTHLRHVH